MYVCVCIINHSSDLSQHKMHFASQRTTTAHLYGYQAYKIFTFFITFFLVFVQYGCNGNNKTKGKQELMYKKKQQLCGVE